MTLIAPSASGHRRIMDEAAPTEKRTDAPSEAQGPPLRIDLFLLELLNRAFPRADHLLRFANILNPGSEAFLLDATADLAASSYIDLLKRTGAVNFYDPAQVNTFVQEIFLHATTVPWTEIEDLARTHRVTVSPIPPIRPAGDISVVLDAQNLSLSERQGFATALSRATGYDFAVAGYRVHGSRTHLALRSTPEGQAALRRLGRARLTWLTGRPVWRVIQGGSVVAFVAASAAGWFAHNVVASTLLATLGVTVTVMAVDSTRGTHVAPPPSPALQDALNDERRRADVLADNLRRTRQQLADAQKAADDTCPSGQIRSEGHGCVSACRDGEIWRDGRCVSACAGGTIWNSVLGCINACNEGTSWQPEKGCVNVCGPGLKWSTDHTCVPDCAEGEIWLSGSNCIAAPRGPGAEATRVLPQRPCEHAVLWKDVAANYHEPYACKFRPGTRVIAVFEGYPEISSDVDNKVSNASIDMTLQPQGSTCQSSECKASHGVPYGSAPAKWSRFRMVSEAVVPESGTITWDLRLGLCQTGPHQGTCSMRAASLRIEPM